MARPSHRAGPDARRQANLYDAVAGRISSEGFIHAEPSTAGNRDTVTSKHVPVHPEEVLFRQKNAPERYEEDDFYFADRHLAPGQQLPDSDLLKAIHGYASDLYTRAANDKGVGDFQSMDGTALMAIGILLEEAAKDLLGESGDMVFVEGVQERHEGREEKVLKSAHGARLQSVGAASVTSHTSEERRVNKRRKLN